MNGVTAHEAAHAFVAALLGFRINRIEVDPDRGGYVDFGSFLTRLRRRQDTLIVLHAGYAAESVFWGLFAHGSKSDSAVFNERSLAAAISIVSRFAAEITALAEYFSHQCGEVDVQELYARGLLPQRLVA